MKSFREAGWALVLALAVGAGTIGLGLAIKASPILSRWDSAGYVAIQRIPDNVWIDRIIWPFNFDFLKWSGRNPSFIYFLVGGFLVALAIKKRSRLPWAILTLVIASMLVMAITETTWKYVGRTRPFEVLPNRVDAESQKFWKGFSSYPSGHVRETALYSTIIAAYFPGSRLAMAGFVIFVGASRLYLGAHYPADVLVGAAVGSLTAISAVKLTRAAESSLRQAAAAKPNREKNFSPPG